MCVRWNRLLFSLLPRPLCGILRTIIFIIFIIDFLESWYWDTAFLFALSFHSYVTRAAADNDIFVCACVHCAGTQGYVYSSFLKAYNPQREVTERTDDFDNLSLFVSGSRSSRSSSMRSFNQYSTSDSNVTSPSTEPLDEQNTSEDNHVRQTNMTFYVCVFSKT